MSLPSRVKINRYRCGRWALQFKKKGSLLFKTSLEVPTLSFVYCVFLFPPRDDHADTNFHANIIENPCT